MTFKKTAKLIEHPRNKEFFTDIADSSPGFWESFKQNILEYGIIAPLIVERGTNHVRSGNQRLKAAQELGMEEVPVVMVEPEVDDKEVTAIEKEDGQMVSSNVYRRTINPFSMFEYIGILRKGATGKSGPNSSLFKKENSIPAIAKEVHKSQAFVSASALWASLEPSEKEELKEWMDKKAHRTEGELIAQVKAMEAGSIEADRRYEELVDLNRSAEERATTLDEMIEERDSKIAELTDVDYEGEIEDKEAEIVKLKEQKTKLSEALKEAQERPDLHVFLKENISMIKKVNGTLKEIVDNKDLLNAAKLEELVKAVARTVKILKDVQNPNNEQNAQRKLT